MSGTMKEPTKQEMQEAATRVEEEADARDAVLAHYHHFLKDLILRHPNASSLEQRELAAKLTIAATTHYHAMQTGRLADAQREEIDRIQKLRDGFTGEMRDDPNMIVGGPGR